MSLYDQSVCALLCVYVDSISGHCVSINSGAPAAGYWYNTACTTTLPYVCEAARPGYTTMSPPGSVTNPTNIGCQPGWTGYGNTCFKVNLLHRKFKVVHCTKKPHIRPPPPQFKGMYGAGGGGFRISTESLTGVPFESENHIFTFWTE